MVSIETVWLKSSNLLDTSAGSSILVENQWYYKKKGGGAGFRFSLNQPSLYCFY